MDFLQKVHVWVQRGESGGEGFTLNNWLVN